MNEDNLCPCKSQIPFERCCGINLGASYKEMEFFLRYFNIDKPIYRYFSKKDWADSFFTGMVRLSTLNICRNHENLSAKDELEGNANLSLSHVKIDNSEKLENKGIISDLKSASVSFSNSSNITINNLSGGLKQIFDAYILCFSVDKSDYLLNKFGKYCIRINKPRVLFYLIWTELKRLRLVSNVQDKLVEYDDNLAIDIAKNRIFEKIGFIKREVYKDENEWRIMYYPNNNNKLTHTQLNIFGVDRICSKLY